MLIGGAEPLAANHGCAARDLSSWPRQELHGRPDTEFLTKLPVEGAGSATKCCARLLR